MFLLAKAPCWNSRGEEELGRVIGSGVRGRKERRENHICSVQTWTVKLNPPEHNLLVRKKKKRIGTSSILAWGKSGVGFSTASKSCPDASVEIALTFLLRYTRDIPSSSNSKRLASTAGVKIRIYVWHFWIQNNSFPQFRANENGIINVAGFQCHAIQNRSKIKIKTIRQIKSIREIKGGKYTKTLAKIWVEGIVRIRDIRGNVLARFIALCMETPCWSSSWWAPT